MKTDNATKLTAAGLAVVAATAFVLPGGGAGSDASTVSTIGQDASDTDAERLTALHRAMTTVAGPMAAPEAGQIVEGEAIAIPDLDVPDPTTSSSVADSTEALAAVRIDEGHRENQRLDWSACEGSVFDWSVNSVRSCGESMAEQGVDRGQQLASDAANHVKREVRKASRKVGEVRDEARETAEQATEDVREAADRAQQWAEETAAGVREDVEQQVAGAKAAADCVTGTPIGEISINRVARCTA